MLSTVGLLVPTRLGKLLLKMQTLVVVFYKSYLNEEVNRTKLSTSVNISCNSLPEWSTLRCVGSLAALLRSIRLVGKDLGRGQTLQLIFPSISDED